MAWHGALSYSGVAGSRRAPTSLTRPNARFGCGRDCVRMSQRSRPREISSCTKRRPARYKSEVGAALKLVSTIVDSRVPERSAAREPRSAETVPFPHQVGAPAVELGRPARKCRPTPRRQRWAHAARILREPPSANVGPYRPSTLRCEPSSSLDGPPPSSCYKTKHSPQAQRSRCER